MGATNNCLEMTLSWVRLEILLISPHVSNSVNLSRVEFQAMCLELIFGTKVIFSIDSYYQSKFSVELLLANVSTVEGIRTLKFGEYIRPRLIVVA